MTHEVEYQDADDRHAAASRRVDIIVSGAGASGLITALALGRAGYSVLCAGVSDIRPTGRTVALFEGSLRFLKELGVWDTLEAVAQPIRAIEIIDDTGARLSAPALTLDASEIGLSALGANIETDRLIAVLRTAAADLPTVELTGTALADIRIDEDAVTAIDGGGIVYTASLMVAADGRNSPTRQAARIGSRTWTYPQVAITGVLGHRKAHHERSTEFHTRGGPCTLVPLQGHSGAPASLIPGMVDEPGRRRATACARRRRIGERAAAIKPA